MTHRVVIESPLAGDFQRNYRFLLWCCRAVWLREGLHGIGSHLLCPWFMDDTEQSERQAGIDNAWVWGGEPHLMFIDLGVSRGMGLAQTRCVERSIPCKPLFLSEYSPASWSAFERGEWPPHTPGFEVAGA